MSTIAAVAVSIAASLLNITTPFSCQATAGGVPNGPVSLCDGGPDWPRSHRTRPTDPASETDSARSKLVAESRSVQNDSVHDWRRRGPRPEKNPQDEEPHRAPEKNSLLDQN
ncbi:hypothetical protein GCM10027169_13450 [Gordonia jinhuaensis]|uniref:Secreted protein n=1 Tax=Gordonia jinhuaensis TaxID=1517702 RepID=A0A916T0X3_9ACTN|nr:hypothetical protein GCM10011489_08790 [Gordonia jinhuaensis]